MIRDAKIDRWLVGLPRVGNPGNPESLIVHGRLQDLFSAISGLAKRSLASKYLHFHFPRTYFIYDSRASWAIKRVAPRLNELPEIRVQPVDREYVDFVRRCIWLRQNIQETYSTRLMPRQIDRILLSIAEDAVAVVV